MDSGSEDEVPTLLEVDSPAEPEPKRVPITLICGFLGAGKSTFLKWILTERHGYRIAVIMNEFGDTADIEAKAINVSSPENSEDVRGQTSEEFLELANGCLCCSIKDSGIAAIEKLMLRKGAFDHILLETTGLADPGPIAAIFWQNEEFAIGTGKDIYLDGVICVVDAVFFEKQLSEDTQSEGIKHSLRQVAAADVLLLNKTDLVSISDLAKTESALRRLNPSIPIYRTVRGNIDLSKVMGIGAYGDRSKRFLETVGSDISEQPPGSMDEPHDHHDHDRHDHGHKGHVGISNIVINFSKPLTDGQTSLLEEWIRNVLWEGVIPPDGDSNTVPNTQPDLTAGMGLLSVHGSGDNGPVDGSHSRVDVLRCKGIWWNERGEQFMLQGVRSMYDISKISAETEEQETMGKVIFIGKGLDEEVKHSFLRMVGL